MKKYVLFDHDGVLVDTERWYYRAGERALADVGFVQDEAKYLRDMSHGQATWAQARAAGVDELSRHVRMAVVTTAKRADFEVIHEHRRILAFMDFALVREDYEHAKPRPEPYLAGLDRFDASAAETIVVEDSHRGLSAAVAAGIDCAVVHHDFTAGQDFSLATHRIDSLAELVGLVV